MIRLIRFLFFFLILGSSLSAQNVFNLENSRKFANYLFDTGQYDLAADEFERVIFLAPSDSSSVLRLLSSYRYQKKYKTGVKRAFDIFPDSRTLDKKVFFEIFHLSLLAKDFSKSRKLLQQNNTLAKQERTNFDLSIMLMDNKWEAATTLCANHAGDPDPFFSKMKGMVDQYSNIPGKSPWLAAGMSTVIPGLGKVYTGNWQDGIIALLFVATNAWQSYRGFDKDGIKSPSGWIFGTIGCGFWLGNIYGSHKAAKKYNRQQQNLFYEKTSKVVFDAF